MLLAEGQAAQSERAFSTAISIKLMEQEFALFEKLTCTPSKQGYGEGMASPGFAFHQSLLSGVFTHPYLLHYEMIAVGDVKMGYINRGDTLASVEQINTSATDDLISKLLKMPMFQYMSKNNAQKLMKHSRSIELPKGWSYSNKDSDQNRMFMILQGEVTLDICNRQQPQDVASNRPVDLIAILHGEKVQIEDRK
jgi:hypothetical protein